MNHINTATIKAHLEMKTDLINLTALTLTHKEHTDSLAYITHIQDSIQTYENNNNQPGKIPLEHITEIINTATTLHKNRNLNLTRITINLTPTINPPTPQETNTPNTITINDLATELGIQQSPTQPYTPADIFAGINPSLTDTHGTLTNDTNLTTEQANTLRHVFSQQN